MFNRTRKAGILVAVTLLLMAGATLMILFSGRTFKVKNNPVYATEISWDILESGEFSIDNLLNYVDETGVNTVILPLYKNGSSVIEINGLNYIYQNSEQYKKTDFVSQLKNELNRKKAQLYISVDCGLLTSAQAADLLGYISKEYKPAAVVLENCSYDAQSLAQLKKTVASKSRNTDFFQQTYRTSHIESSQFQFDGYILEDVNADMYSSAKQNYPKSKVLLHFSTDSAISDSFILTNFAELDGVVAVQYTGENTPDAYLQTALKPSENIEKFGFAISDKFTVTYPTKDITTYYSGVFVTGTGAEDTVNINGISYPAQPDGVFGVYITLQEGANSLIISNKGKAYQYTVTKKSYKTSTTKYEAPWDETQYLAPGRVVQTTSRLTSMLSDPGDDSAIIAGIEPGTKLIVAESVETIRSGYKTYAYKLSNGGYVLASKVEITDEITGDYMAENDEDVSEYIVFETARITGFSLEQLEKGDEQLYITVSNQPAVVHSYSKEKLSLLFLDAVAENISLPWSQFYKDYAVTQTDSGVVIDLVFDQTCPLWGYDVKYEYGQAVVYLKQSPKLVKGEKPLANVTVMLDAGHGGKDSGALGVASTNGPLEKDLNLAVAKATKSVLESYGATVYMTREDDSFPSLDDRRDMARVLKPDLFIAVHHNSMDYSYNSTNAKGSECYYFTHQSKQLAELMCENITAATGRVNRGAFNGYYYVTRTDIAPSVLMEYSFVINPAEFSNTYLDQDIYKAAFGTAMAVLKAIP